MHLLFNILFSLSVSAIHAQVIEWHIIMQAPGVLDTLLLSENGQIRDGFIIHRDATGEIDSVTTFQDGKPIVENSVQSYCGEEEKKIKCGLWTFYGKDMPKKGWPPGSIMEHAFYIKNRKHGLWVKFYEDGLPKIIGEFCHGKPNGYYIGSPLDSTLRKSGYFCRGSHSHDGQIVMSVSCGVGPDGKWHCKYGGDSSSDDTTESSTDSTDQMMVRYHIVVSSLGIDQTEEIIGQRQSLLGSGSLRRVGPGLQGEVIDRTKVDEKHSEGPSKD